MFKSWVLAKVKDEHHGNNRISYTQSYTPMIINEESDDAQFKIRVVDEKGFKTILSFTRSEARVIINTWSKGM